MTHRMNALRRVWQSEKKRVSAETRIFLKVKAKNTSLEDEAEVQEVPLGNKEGFLKIYLAE